jgi:hypothetical protein
MSVPISSFRQPPPASRYRSGASPAEKTLWQARQQDSTDEARGALIRWNEYLGGYREQTITTTEGSFQTLVRGSGDGAAPAAGGAPWQMVRLADRVLRIFPSAIWDGKGHSIWCTYAEKPSIAESFFDLILPKSPTRGFVWLECTVDDTNDDHGILESAIIKTGTEVAFNSRADKIVNIALATYFLNSTNYTFDPVRGFVFVLRRFGPRTSITWDVEPL